MDQPSTARLKQTSKIHPFSMGLLFLALPPLLWMVFIYLGSLFQLLWNSFYSLDPMTGLLNQTLTLQTYAELFQPANLDIVLRTLFMAALVTLIDILIAFPIAYYMAKHTHGMNKAFWYLAILLPLWSSYLVRVYSWKLILSKDGIISWLAEKLHLSSVLEAVLSVPNIGGTSLSVSLIGTTLVLVYAWLPFAIVPIYSTLERIPKNMALASADLGAKPWQTFRYVIWDLSMPGVAAGSIFTFSLTLGDYIIPSIIGPSRLFIGQAVYMQQGTAGNIPMAAVLSIVPVVIVLTYLWFMKKLGAFQAL